MVHDRGDRAVPELRDFFEIQQRHTTGGLFRIELFDLLSSLLEDHDRANSCPIPYGSVDLALQRLEAELPRDRQGGDAGARRGHVRVTVPPPLAVDDREVFRHVPVARSDHLVREDGLPGAAVTEEEVGVVAFRNGRGMTEREPLPLELDCEDQMNEPREEIGDLESDGDEIEVREGCDDVGPFVREPAYAEPPAGFRTQQIHDRDVRLIDELAVADVVDREAGFSVHGLRKRGIQTVDESKLEVRLHRNEPEDRRGP